VRGGRATARLLAAGALLLAGAVSPAGPAAGAEAGGAPRLRTLFPRQAPIAAEGGRLVRLILPPEVLAACRPDLSDLRVFDGDDREVPFLVDGGWATGRRLEVERTVDLEPVAVDRRRSDRETGPPLWRESYELALPADLPAGAAWELVAVTSRPSFVKRVDVTAAGVELVRDGSLFRLAGPPRERTAVPLPDFRGRRLSVVLEGEDGGYLQPVFRLRTAHDVAGRAAVAVALATIERREEGGRTVLVLARPRGLVPGAIRLATSTAAFSRPVEVWDEGAGSAAGALGRRTLFRVRALTAVEGLELPLAPARGDRLRVVIADGDSPPLGDLAGSAVVRQPALLFTLPAPASGETGPAAATLRFGGARAFRPSYDLAALPPALTPAATGTAAEVAERLYDPEQVAEARLGDVVGNPDFDPAPALAFAHHPSAALDPRVFRYRRTLAARPSPEGLVRLRLAPEDLAHARPDLADLRVLGAGDGGGRQWAYLLERDAAESRQPLTVGGPSTKDGLSRYRLEPPVHPAGIERIVLEIDAPYFDRAFTLTGYTPSADGGAEVPLATGRLVRRAGDPRPLTLAFAARRLDRLELAVVDGDDAPLVLTRADAVLPLPELYFAAPAGDYALLLGDPEAEPPRYELSRVRDVVLAVAAGDAQAGPLVANPDFSRGARLATAPGAQRVLLWVALGLAVVVLGGLTLKLARRES
jgi:hypothetical protein